MWRSLFNWRTGLTLIAIGIVIGTIFYSQYLARKIAREEREKVQAWAEAVQFTINAPADVDTRLASSIITHNTDIPIIETNENDSIISFVNLDSGKIARDPEYLSRKLRQLKSGNAPIREVDPLNNKSNLYYYGDSVLLQEVRYYPIVQLFIVALFLLYTLYNMHIRNKSTQNQLWAGMAKETAHQLGTPLSSLEGWVEMMKENRDNDKIVSEMEKDVHRLKLVSERFSKIGSIPKLENKNLVFQVQQVVDYIRKRAPEKVHFKVDIHGNDQMNVMISESLFDWVMENLLKNALDAMEGKGEITIDMQSNAKHVVIDVTDTGKGISAANLNRVFKPGFTTKKRGWGLGLTLSKRIIENYHKGQLYVRHSEAGKGTTFRIMIPR
jgi:signal transduction histidine kinase